MKTVVVTLTETVVTTRTTKYTYSLPDNHPTDDALTIVYSCEPTQQTVEYDDKSVDTEYVTMETTND